MAGPTFIYSDGTTELPAPGSTPNNPKTLPKGKPGVYALNYTSDGIPSYSFVQEAATPLLGQQSANLLNTNYSNTTGTSTSTSTSFNVPDQRTIDLQNRQIDEAEIAAKRAYDLSVRQGDRVAADSLADRINALALAKLQIAGASDQGDANRLATALQNAQTLTATSAENAANRAFQGNESAAGRSFTAAQDVLKAANDADAAAISRAYQTYSTQGTQKFTAGENAINRALTSGQFAATNALDLADRAAAAKRDDLARNLAYVEMTKSPDLTGFQRLMQASGNNIGNALLGRGDSLTEQGQLGAARTLRDIRTPYVPPAGYRDPNANFNFQDTAYMTQPAFNAPVFQTRASTFVEPERTYNPVYTASSAPITPVPKVVAPKAQMLTAQQNLAAHIIPTAANSSNFENRPLNAAETAQWQFGIPNAPYFVTGNPASPGGPNYVPSETTGLAYGTGPGAMPIYRSAVASPPMGGGMDTVTGRYAYGSLGMMGAPRYALGNPMMMGQPAPPMPAMDGGMSPFGDMGQPATGTFIAGDSTDPMDPAAGGAQPEMVTLNDPEGNATADVMPMTQPGVGPDEGAGGASVGALLMAISKFLMAEEAKSAVAMPPPPMMGPELGMMGAPRQAYGALGMPRYNMGAFGRYNMGMPRYAAGTMPGFEISAEDQPYVNEVLATRRATPYNVNPFAANYQMQSPTARAIGESAFQTATGVPGTELDYISKMYEPQGLARQSTYNQELNLGI